MNGHPDLLRQNVPNMHQTMMGQPFLQQQAQQPQQPMAHNMSLLPNGQGGNPGLGLMGQPGTSNPNYAAINMQTANHRRVYMAPHSNGPGMNPAGGAGPSHMAGLAPNQMQNMVAFPGNGMTAMRRVPNQQPLAQGGAHGMPGMQPGVIGGGMQMNGQPQMPGIRATMSQQQQMHIQQMRQQQQQQQAQGGGISPDMGLPMNRPGHMQAGPPLPPHARNGSGQLMPTHNQPPTIVGQTHGMPQMNHPFGNPMPLPHQHQQSQLGPSPHVGSSGQPQPSMGGPMAGTPIPPPSDRGRAQMTPDNAMFMFQNGPMQQQLQHNVPRLPMNMNTPFNITPSPTPLNAGDMQRANASMDNSAPLTPAQVIGMGGAGDNFSSGSFTMGQTPSSAPPRPPSHNGPHFPMSQSQSQPSLPSQQSPRQPDHPASQMHPGAGVMQRPQSQPQVAHRQSPIPPGTTRTPRVSQSSLPMNAGGMLPPQRVPTAGPGPSPQAASHPPVHPPASAPPTTTTHPSVQIAPRPSTGNAAPASATSSTASSSSAPPPRAPSTSAPDAPQQPGPAPPSGPANAQLLTNKQPSIYPVGFGQCLGRLLQFSGHLGGDNNDRLKMSYWQRMVASYFSEKATMKLTLWKDNQQQEAKPFEIGYPIFSRFFLVTAQSGVKSQTINIDGARERIITPSRAVVECATAAWTFRYTNGYSITLRGPFTAEIVVQPMPSPSLTTNVPGSGPAPMSYTLLFERLQFDAFWHDKYLAFDAIQGERIPESPRMMATPPGGPDGDPSRYESEPRMIIDRAYIPAEPINAFGIPQATMRCLELAESVSQMSDLIQFSVQNSLGPLDSLTAFAEKIRRDRGSGLHVPNGMDHLPGPSSHAGGLNGAGAGLTGPSSSFGTSMNPAGPSQPPFGSDAGPQPDGVAKAPKATAPPSQASGSTPSASTPASAPTPGGPTTPSMGNSSLKRKASARTGEDSPTTADSQPAKRAPRKRGKTQGSSS